MELLKGRQGLIFGVANERSIAWHIAKALVGAGAECGYAFLPGERNERRFRRTLVEGGQGEAWCHPCDVTRDEDLEATFEAARERFDVVHFVVHSIAFAQREYLQPGRFVDTPRAAWAEALDISAYSLVALARCARDIMPRGGSILAMTYFGSEKVVPGYNVMGVAKAALECAARYLAAELGERGIRVNTISAGPLRTLSAMAVGGIDEMFAWVEKKAPLRRNITVEEVASTALFLVSDLSSGITGENIYVDAGYNIVGL